MLKWRVAMTKIANVSGWDSLNRPEAELIQVIVDSLRDELKNGKYRYEAFSSFRGSDTRWNFTDHLYAALHRKQVVAFKDDNKFKEGTPEVRQAIQDSRFAIIIFSKNYVDSTGCLEEFEVILECMKQGTLTAIPVFYGVYPSEVQKLTGEYGKAFARHAIDNPDKVLKWRKAITEITDVSGWDAHNRYEAAFIEDIVDALIRQLRNSNRKFPK